MRYRALDPNGDSTFGSGRTVFLVNNAAAVAQLVQTRLLLATGEWFLDVTDGTPYSTEIIGKGTTAVYDAAIQQRVLETEGVSEIVSYTSDLDRRTRKLTVSMTLNTIFGPTTLSIVAPTSPKTFQYAITNTGAIGVDDSGGAIIV